MKEQPQRPDELNYEGLIAEYGGDNFNLENARKVCNYLTAHCQMRDRFIRFLEGRIASEIVAKYQSGNTEQPQKTKIKIWSCKIGETNDDNLPDGADGPMRKAVSAAYRNLTGQDPMYIFSGWAAELTEYERAFVEGREPIEPEQPQKPEHPKHFSVQHNGHTIAVFGYSDSMEYFSLLEQENTALKDRVAELEKGQEIITQWCKLSVEHMKQYAGDQSEYDGMYQASADLLERINGTMPWPDLVMERLSEVK